MYLFELTDGSQHFFTIMQMSHHLKHGLVNHSEYLRETLVLHYMIHIKIPMNPKLSVKLIQSAVHARPDNNDFIMFSFHTIK